MNEEFCRDKRTRKEERRRRNRPSKKAVNMLAKRCFLDCQVLA